MVIAMQQRGAVTDETPEVVIQMIQSEWKEKLSRVTRLTGSLCGLGVVAVLLSSCGGGNDTSSSSSSASSSDSSSASDSSSSSSSSSSSQSSSSSSSSSTGPTASGGWTDVTPGIPGGQVSVVGVVPGQDKVIALTGTGTAYETVTAWSSTDGGTTWVQLGQGAKSQALQITPSGITFDPADPNTFWIYGNFPGQNGGIYKTSDGGNTFTGVVVPGMDIDSAEDISVSADGNTVLASQHQRSQSVYVSTDGGTTWSSIGGSLPPGTAYSDFTYVVYPMTYIVGCSFALDGTWDTGGGTTGIYRTTDGGATWNKVADAYEVFGSPAAASNGTLYWSYFNGGDGGILTSSDGGSNWFVMVPDQLIYSIIPAVLANGEVASVNTSDQVVLFTPGSTTSTTLPGNMGLTSVYGMAYDAVRNSLFTWQLYGGVSRYDLQN